KISAPEVRAIAEGVGDERESPTVSEGRVGSGHHLPLANRLDPSGAEAGSGVVEVRRAAMGRGAGASSAATRFARAEKGGADATGVRRSVRRRRQGKSPEAQRNRGEGDDPSRSLGAAARRQETG